MKNSTLMEIDGLYATLHMPEALKSQKGEDGSEIAQGLPPCHAQKAYVVDEYPACPESWERSGPGVMSYFVGIREGAGMWLDFNPCRSHTHDVAIVTSVQGVNPITGQRQEGTQLEQYRTKCPLHDVDFKDDRFCSECNFKWPAQNYLSTTGTPNGMLWIDGFRSADGVVRQYVFTANEARGVAAVKLGDQRVHSIGIAYRISKEAKPEPDPRLRPLGDVYFSSKSVKGYSGGSFSVGSTAGGPSWSVNESYGSTGGAEPVIQSYNSVVPMSSGNLRALHGLEADIEEAALNVTRSFKKLEVAAGARIDQEIYLDPKPLDYWQETLAGVIYVTYAPEEQVAEIIAQGRRQVQEEGALAGIEVGN